MEMNEHNRDGLDVGYFKRELKKLSQSLDDRPCAEVTRYLMRLANVASKCHWAVLNPGLADQFKNEAVMARKELGLGDEKSDYVIPSDIRDVIVALKKPPLERNPMHSHINPFGNNLPLPANKYRYFFYGFCGEEALTDFIAQAENVGCEFLQVVPAMVNLQQVMPVLRVFVRCLATEWPRIEATMRAEEQARNARAN